MSLVVAVDFGSTFTKAVAVDAGSGELVARAEHRTTIETDVMQGWLACRAALEQTDRGFAKAEVLACSSAGGGLRIGVVGNEELVTAEAGRRVALSSGGHVVAVLAGGSGGGSGVGPPDLAPLAAGRPAGVLLGGGPEGGDRGVLLRCAHALAGRPWPVVVAGNCEAAEEVAAVLAAAGTPCTVTANVLPRIGVLDPGPARRTV